MKAPFSGNTSPEQGVDGMIQMAGVGKTYFRGGQPTPVLRDLALTVPKGAFVAICGPSGAGKTTLLDLLGCLDRPTAGSYRLAGEEVTDLPPGEMARLRRETVGFVFQSAQLLPGLMAAENVQLPLLLRGEKASLRREKSLAALEAVGLTHRAKYRPGQLSGGQQQRVALARVLAAGSPLILADEPTGSLDSQAGAQILDLLSGLNRAGRTVVMITHDPGAAARAGQRLWLREGRLFSNPEPPEKPEKAPACAHTII